MSQPTKANRCCLGAARPGQRVRGDTSARSSPASWKQKHTVTQWRWGDSTNWRRVRRTWERLSYLAVEPKCSEYSKNGHGERSNLLYQCWTWGRSFHQERNQIWTFVQYLLCLEGNTGTVYGFIQSAWAVGAVYLAKKVIYTVHDACSVISLQI